MIGQPDFEQNPVFNRDKDKYSSPMFLRSVLIGAVRHNQKNQPNQLLISLPASHYRDEEVKATLKKLVGEHLVTINGKDHNVQVTKVHTLLQPLGAIFDVVMNPDGTIDEEYLNKTFVVVDIGFGTTDVAMIYIGKDGDISLRKTLYVPYSMFDVYSNMWDQMQKDFPAFGSKILNAFKMDEELRDAPDDYVFEQAGIKVENAGLLRKQMIKEVSGRIITHIKGNGISLEQADRVIFTGGGTEAMLSELKPHVEGVNASKTTDSQMSIVRGLYEYGKIITSVEV
ncbi:hypothetical protein [Bacillus carboniphilus]|uniref:ParM/StbA family protein n=1 Tax=Bacillus carboniphilus TaxID=86663 RepID=UPI0035319371